MQRKLIRVGTSAAVLIPKAVLEEYGVRIGDIVNIDLSRQTKVPKKALINPEVIQWTDEFIREYKPMLKRLAAS